MSVINFCGGIYNTNINDVLKVLSKILDHKKIKHRSRMFGDEINYEDTNLEIYFESDYQYKSNLTDKDKEEYRINGEFFTNNKDIAKVFLERLGSLFYEEKIKYQFEYYEQTDDGEEIGDSYTIECLDF